MTPTSMTCWCDPSCVNQPQEHQGPLHAVKQNVEHVLSSAPTPVLMALTPRWTSQNSSTAWRTTLYTSFIVPNVLNSTSEKLDTPLTPTSKNILWILNTVDKPAANNFYQTSHIIHIIHIIGLWLLFPDSVNDRKTWNHTWLINLATGNQVK